MRYTYYFTSAVVLVVSSAYVAFRKLAFVRLDSNYVNKFLSPKNLSSVAVFGHKGAGLDAPENTLEAILQAKQLGADGVEVDVEFTRDSVAILLHDPTVDRTTDGQGEVSDLSFESLQKLDAAYHHEPRNQFKNVRIPAMRDAVEQALNLNLKIIFDVKSCESGNPHEALSALYKEFPALYEQAIVCSFYPWIIYKVRSMDEKIVTGLTWRPHFIALDGIYGEPRKGSGALTRLVSPLLDVLAKFAHEHLLWRLLGNSVFICHIDAVSPYMVHKWRSHGVQVIPWNANTRAEQVYAAHVLQVPYITDELGKRPEGDLQSESHV